MWKGDLSFSIGATIYAVHTNNTTCVRLILELAYSLLRAHRKPQPCNLIVWARGNGLTSGEEVLVDIAITQVESFYKALSPTDMLSSPKLYHAYPRGFLICAKLAGSMSTSMVFLGSNLRSSARSLPSLRREPTRVGQIGNLLYESIQSSPWMSCFRSD